MLDSLVNFFLGDVHGIISMLSCGLRRVLAPLHGF
jgi:hypothetical protein